MAKRNEGIAFHVHHDVLAEYCSDYQNRVSYVKEAKPAEEVKLRLRLFKLIPLNKIPWSVVKADAERKKADAERKKAYAEREKAYAERKKAYAEWKKAYAEWEKADAEREKAYAEWEKADAEREKADAEWEKADAEWEKAYAERKKADAEWKKAIEAAMPDFIKLHARLCPACPWDGKTIFPKERR